MNPTTPEEITEGDLATTQISFSFQIAPIKHVMCDLSSILGRFVEELITAFYPKIVSRRANIVITELVNNALENMLYPDSALSVELSLEAGAMLLRFSNRVPEETYLKVKSHVDAINASDDVRAMLKETIRQRRKQRRKGGLGLMRLVTENKFKISVDYREDYMIVATQLDLGGLE